jgi:hypothetical protein
MPLTEQTIERIRLELEAAASARSAGNEGKVRVCARRAAGLALMEHLSAITPAISRLPDAMTLISSLRDDPAVGSAVREAASRLVARVAGDPGYPAGFDPLADADSIIRYASEHLDADAG